MISHDRNLWQNQNHREEPKFSLVGDLRMIMPCEPWRISLTLKTVEINQHWVRATLDRKSFEQLFTFEDLDVVFRLESNFGVQIEPDDDFLPTPSLQTTLSGRDVFSGGIQLQFNFLNSNQDLDELLHEIANQRA